MSDQIIPNNSLQNISEKVDAIAQNTIKENKDNYEGVSKNPETLDSLGKDILKKLDLILNNVKESFENIDNEEKSQSSFLEKLVELASESAGTDNLKEEGSKKDKKGDKTPTNKLDIADIKELDKNNGLGFAILYWKLDEISKKIGGEDGDEKKKGGGLGKFFSGLLEGAAGLGLIAVALLAFAGALTVFSFVDWLPALAGLVNFTVFTLGIIFVAKKIGEELETFVEFSKASLILSLAIGSFAISLYIAGAIFNYEGVDLGFITLPPINLLGALTAIGFFTVFLLGIALVSRVAAKEIPNFTEFGKGATILAMSIGVFAISLYIAGAIFNREGVDLGFTTLPPIDLLGALTAIGFFSIFLLTAGVVARIAGDNTKEFVSFASGSMLLTLALVTFSMALYVSSAIVSGKPITIFGKQVADGMDIKAALVSLGIFTAFILGMTGIAILANSFAGNFVLFAATSLLLCAALGSFSIAIAMSALAITGEGGQVGPFKIAKFDGGYKTAFIALGVFGTFITGMVGIASLAALAAIPIAVGSVALAALAGTTILMSKALSSAAAVINGGILTDENGNEQSTKGIDQKGVDLFFSTFKMFIDKFASLQVEMGKGLKDAKKSAKLLKPVAECISEISVALITAADASFAVKEKLGELSDPENNAISQLFNTFLMMVKYIGPYDGKIGFPVKSIKDAKKNAKLLKPVSECISKVALTLLDAAEAADKVTPENVDKITGLFTTFLTIVDRLVIMTQDMEPKSAVAFALVAKSMEPIVNSIGALVNIIDSTAVFATDEGKAKIDQANASINYLMNGPDGKSGFVAIFNTISNNIKGIGKKQAEALSSFDPISKAITNLVGVVQQTMTIDPSLVSIGVDNTNAVAGLISTVIDSLWDIKNKVKPSKMNPIIEFLTGGGEYTSGGIDTILQKIADVSPVMEKIKIPSGVDQSMKTFVKSINYFEDLDKDAFENIDKATETINRFTKTNIEGFTGQITSLAESMKGLGEVITNSSPFSVLNEQLDTTCESMKAINSQVDIMIEHFEKLAKKAEDVNNATKGGIFKSFKTLKPETESTSGEDKDKSIIDILRGWDKDGVVVRTKTPPKKEDKPLAVAFSI